MQRQWELWEPWEHAPGRLRGPGPQPASVHLGRTRPPLRPFLPRALDPQTQLFFLLDRPIWELCRPAVWSPMAAVTSPHAARVLPSGFGWRCPSTGMGLGFAEHEAQAMKWGACLSEKRHKSMSKVCRTERWEGTCSSSGGQPAPASRRSCLLPAHDLCRVDCSPPGPGPFRHYHQSLPAWLQHTGEAFFSPRSCSGQVSSCGLQESTCPLSCNLQVTSCSCRGGAPWSGVSGPVPTPCA